MKNLLMLAAAGALALGIAACSSDPVSTPNGTVNKFVEFKKGDKFTYEYYDRKADNTPDASTKQIRVWTVDSTGMNNTLGRDNVARAIQVTFDATGTTETGRDTVYLQASQQGPVYQYDVIGGIIGHIPAAATVVPLLTKQWVQISDVKTPTPFSWSVGQLTKSGIPLLTFTISMTTNMNATHLGQGKRTVVVPDSTFTKAFNTDHWVSVAAVDEASAKQVLNDSMAVHYDVDINAGIVRQTLDSKTVTITLPPALGGATVPQAIAGFEMNLQSVVRAK